MSLNIETTQGLERRVTITVPAEAVEKATREEFKRAAKNVRVDGFRKGHVPAHIIEQRFGASIRQDVLNDLLPRHFFDAVIAEKINIAGRQLSLSKRSNLVKIYHLLQLSKCTQKLN